jgi:hypothetical protein
MELVTQDNFNRFYALPIITRDSEVEDNILACIMRVAFDTFDYKNYCYNTNLISW